MKSAIEIKFLELLRKPVKLEEEIKEKERLRIIWTTELKQELKGLSTELKDAGSKYTDPWEMVNTRDPYPEAIEILIKHLPKQYHRRNKEGIVRALTVIEAKGKANAALIKEYNTISNDKENDSLRWAIGNAIYFIITSNDIEDILSIVENKENGISRARFILALGKVESENVENTLIKLLDDEEVTVYALEALTKLKSKKAIEKITSLINSSSPTIKKESLKALNKIG